MVEKKATYAVTNILVNDRQIGEYQRIIDKKKNKLYHKYLLKKIQGINIPKVAKLIVLLDMITFIKKNILVTMYSKIIVVINNRLLCKNLSKEKKNWIVY